MNPAAAVVLMKEAHEREHQLFSRLTEDQIRGASRLPGWTRGHVLASRVVFMRAALQQIDAALAGYTVEFFAGGRIGRDAEIESYAHLPAAELVAAVRETGVVLEDEWARVDTPDWARPTSYRGGTLTDLVLACWREAEIHLVDLDVGIDTTHWPPALCVHLFEFLEPRVPDGVRVGLVTPEGRTWSLGDGEPVQVRGALTDLAAWLAGRAPVGPVESSTGTLPELGRLRDARR
jgi:maleylpyruvate isomerase